MEKVTLKIRTENGKIYAEASARMSQNAFKTLRANGWLYSRTAAAFIFNDNDEGAKRVRRLIDGRFVKFVYGISDEEREEVKNEITAEFFDEETAKRFTGIWERLDGEKVAEAKAKEQAKEQAAKNHLLQRKKIVDDLGKLPNGWNVLLSYGFACPILSTAEFLERGGIGKQGGILDLCKEYGIEAPAGFNFNDKDILSFKICYDFDEGFPWRNIPARKNAVLRVSAWRVHPNGGLVSHSGDFNAEIILAEDLPNRSVKRFINFAELCDSEMQAATLLLFFNYCLQNGKKEVKTVWGEKVNGNGEITIENLKILSELIKDDIKEYNKNQAV